MTTARWESELDEFYKELSFLHLHGFHDTAPDLKCTCVNSLQTWTNYSVISRSQREQFQNLYAINKILQFCMFRVDKKEDVRRCYSNTEWSYILKVCKTGRNLVRMKGGGWIVTESTVVIYCALISVLLRLPLGWFCCWGMVADGWGFIKFWSMLQQNVCCATYSMVYGVPAPRLLQGKFVSVTLRLGASTEGQSHCSEPNSHQIIVTYSVLRHVLIILRSELTRLCDLCFLSQVPVPSWFLKVIQ